MENQVPEQAGANKKKSVFNFFTILALVAVLALAGYFIFAKKPANTSGSAKLSWNANTESDLAGYKIYYGTSPRTGDCPPAGYPNKIDVGKTNSSSTPSYTINNLGKSKTYYFSITSYDASGNESCFSDEMNKKIN